MLLPPISTPLERAFETANEAAFAEIPVPLRDLWNPQACPAALLPFFAWGLSVDFWDADWSEAEKRSAIAGAIDAQRRKGTRASLRAVLDRFDPLIELVEWFQDRDTLDPYTFRLELPLVADSDTVFDDALVNALLRDIAAVKPLRAHMTAVYRLRASAAAWLLSGAQVAGFRRDDLTIDLATPLDPAWASYLQTENGEPLSGGEPGYLETT